MIPERWVRYVTKKKLQWPGESDDSEDELEVGFVFRLTRDEISFDFRNCDNEDVRSVVRNVDNEIVTVTKTVGD